MNNWKKTILTIACLIILKVSFAQNMHLSSIKGETTLGLGLGLPYGGIGLRLGTNVADELNLFAGAGYMLAGVGFNVGFLKDFKSNSATQFYLTGMYGTNAAVKVENLSDYDKTYTGPTFGLGVKINSRKTEGNFWDIGVLVPVRPSSYNDDLDTIKSDPRIASITEPLPVLLVIGYNFNL